MALAPVACALALALPASAGPRLLAADAAPSAPAGGERERVGPQGKTARQLITDSDRNGDGRLTVDEFPGPPQTFQKLDGDADGFVTIAEFEAFWSYAFGFGQGSAAGQGTAGGGAAIPAAAPEGARPDR